MATICDDPPSSALWGICAAMDFKVNDVVSVFAFACPPALAQQWTNSKQQRECICAQNHQQDPRVHPQARLKKHIQVIQIQVLIEYYRNFPKSVHLYFTTQCGTCTCNFQESDTTRFGCKVKIVCRKRRIKPIADLAKRHYNPLHCADYANKQFRESQINFKPAWIGFYNHVERKLSFLL